MKRGIYIKSKILITTVATIAIIGGYNFLERDGFAFQSTRNISTEYATQDLSLEFASDDVNWRGGITYDADKYVLDVVDKYDAEVALYNRPGTHKVEYRLRLKDEADKLAYQVKTEAIEEYLERLEVMYEEMALEQGNSQVELDSIDSISITKPLVMVTEEESALEDGAKQEISHNYEELEGTEVLAEEPDGADNSLSEEWAVDSIYYEDLLEYIAFKQELAITEGRINEVGSIYFYRDVTVEVPYEYDDLYITEQTPYDLEEGVVFDTTKYTMEIQNKEVLNANVPGTYILIYTLTDSVGYSLSFDRKVHVTALDGNVEYLGPQTFAYKVSDTGQIRIDGSYYKEVSGESDAYITIEEGIKNVTLHISGTGTIGGVILPDSMETFVLWAESGCEVLFDGYTSNLVSYAALEGGEGAQVFVLGEGDLTLKGGNAGDGDAKSWTSGAIGQGGVGASAGISTKKSISIFSTNGNISVIGGNGGSGSDGGPSSGYKGSAVANYTVTSGSGGGGGGYIAMATGERAQSGGDGGQVRRGNYGAYFYADNNLVGGAGGSGSFGGGGGAGADRYRDYITKSLTIMYFQRQGVSGYMDSDTYQIYNGTAGLAGRPRQYATATSAGGIGGTSYGLDQPVSETSPVYFHYSGGDLANPIGSSGTLYGYEVSDDLGLVLPYGIGHRYYGFTSLDEEMDAGLSNVQDMKTGEFTQVGVSYSPAPPIDLDIYYLDPLGITSVLTWYDPDYKGRVGGSTGYEFPDGYEIDSYNVKAYIGDAYFETEPIAENYKVSQVATGEPGYLSIPESDAKDNVDYWSVSLVAKKGNSYLESPTTVIQAGTPVIAVQRTYEDEYCGVFRSLGAALAFIESDEWIGTEDEPAEYRLIYLEDYHHNEPELALVNIDMECLENFDQGNTHLIFESDVKPATETTEEGRFLIRSSVFALPKGDPNSREDDNITVTFRDFNLKVEDLVTYGCDLTIEESATVSVTNLRAINSDDEVGDVITSLGKNIDIQGDLDVINIVLDNGKYAPSLSVGCLVNEFGTIPASTYNVNTLSGAASVIIGTNASVIVETDLKLPYYDNSILEDKNGHLILRSAANITLPGGSTSNSIGSLVVPSNSARITFTNTFGDSKEAPLWIIDEAIISDSGLQVEIDGADEAEDEWRGKDIIRFSSLDKLAESDYWSLWLYLGTDEDTYSLEVLDYRKLKIEVEFPDESTREFPSYESALTWIQSTYVGENGTYTITLIDDYDRLGLGGEGLESYDNRALRNFYKSGAKLIFNSTINEETGKLYSFSDYNDDHEGYSWYNDTFALPENPLREDVQVELVDLDFTSIESVYLGNIELIFSENVVSDNPVNYYGTYDMTEEAGVNQSSLIINRYCEVGLDTQGNGVGIGVLGFHTVTASAYSKLYVSQVKKVEHYATTFDRYVYSNIYYQEAGIYEWGTINMTSSDINTYFNHPDAIVYLYGDGFLRTNPYYKEIIYFAEPADAINRDLYVFFSEDGIQEIEHANIAQYTLSEAVSDVVGFVARENVIAVNAYVVLVAPDAPDEKVYGEHYYYYSTLTNAVNKITSDSRNGEYEIIFMSDYQLDSVDNISLRDFYREGVALKFSSKFREDVYIENIRYIPEESDDFVEVGIFRRLWSSVVEFFTGGDSEDDDSEDDDIDPAPDEIEPYEGYSLVGLQTGWSSGREAILLPTTYATACYFDDIVFNIATETNAALIRGGGGGLTLGDNIRATNVTEEYPNGIIDACGYWQWSSAYLDFNQDPYIRILGGHYRNIYGVQESTSSVAGSVLEGALIPKVYLEGGYVTNLHGGTAGTGYGRATEIHISGGVVTDSIEVADVGGRNGSLHVYGEQVLPYTRNFDYIYIDDKATVVMNGILTRQLNTSLSLTNLGTIHFGADSQLQLYEIPEGTGTSVYNTAGQLITDGPGASLIVPKMGNGVECLKFDKTSSAGYIDTSNGLLTVSPALGFAYEPPTYIQDDDGNWHEELNPESNKRFAVGDKIFYFATTKFSSEISHYINGFAPLGMVGNSPTGYISLGAMPITMAKNGGEHTYYTSIADACEEIGRDEETANDIDYTFVIREDNYTISSDDSVAMAAYAGNAKSITFTSTFVLTDRDTLGYGEKVGETVTRNVYISGNLICYTDMYFDNIEVEVTTQDSNIYANGFNLYMGTNDAPYLPVDPYYGKVDMIGSNFPNIYGGCATVTGTNVGSTGAESVESTYLVLGSGNYNNVYGGAYLGTVYGDTYLQIGNHPSSPGYAVNNVVIAGDVYGGGHNDKTSSSSNNMNGRGYVKGSAELVIFGAEFRKTQANIIGSGAVATVSTTYNQGRVDGDVSIEIWDAYAPNSDVVVAGSNTCNVGGNVYIEVAEGGGTPVAKSASVYGTISTSSSAGNISGDMEVRIHSGQGLATIKESKNHTTRRVIGEIDIYMGTGGPGGGIGGANALALNLDTVDQFNNLYIGYNEESKEDDEVGAVGYSSGAAHVTIGSTLDGIATLTTEAGLRNGTIHILEGSSLTLPSVGTVEAYSLVVDGTKPRLYIGKSNKEDSTNPLILKGDNLSGNIQGEPGDTSGLNNRLIVGLESDEFVVVGDNLIQFEVTPNNARAFDYISGIDKFDIYVSDTEPGVIEFGTSSVPIITQTLVEHKDQNGNVTEPATGTNASINGNLGSELNTVMKTLYFNLENEDDSGNYNGYKIQSGYVSNTAVIDTEWSEGGDMPDAVTEISITETDTTGLWQGKVSLEIESYGLNQKLYYAHVRDDRGAVKVISLDVHSPIYTTDPLVQQQDGGDYHISLNMTDPVYDVESGDDEIPPYKAWGLSQGAFTIGTTDECPGVSEILDKRDIDISTNVKGIITIDSSTCTFVVPKELLEEANREDTVIYMYLKDTLGNTRQIAIPMSEYMIDVTIPTRVGMIAVASEVGRLLAPQCYVVNNGNNTVKSEIINVDIAGQNAIEYVINEENLGKNKMSLYITSSGGTSVASYKIPIQYLNSDSMPNGLHIGTMSPYGTDTHASHFTYSAQYNANQLDITGDWDLFTMKYRFTVLPN